MQKSRFTIILLLSVFTYSAVWGQRKYDLNGDGRINVGDLTELASAILSGAVVNVPIGKAQTFAVDGVQFTMLPVEGGTFLMGSPKDDSDALENEKPIHSVTVSGFYMCQTEVTQALWKAVMGKLPTSNKEFNDQYPVRASRADFLTFIQKLNEKTGKRFRMPTEAEWEFAARGGIKSKGYKYAGSDNIDAVAWYSGNTNPSGLREVKTKAPNELGLYDMSGNAWEWCADLYDQYSYLDQTDPTGPVSGDTYVLRGGSHVNQEHSCRVAARSQSSPSSATSSMRLALNN